MNFDLSAHRLPKELSAVTEKIGVFVKVMEFLGKPATTIFLFDCDYAAIERFVQKYSNGKYGVKDMNWRGMKVEKGGPK